MYLHTENHVPSLRQFICENPLGILTSAIESPTYPMIQSSHIPFILDIQNEDDEDELGVLRGHIARANPHANVMIEELKIGPSKNAFLCLEKEVMVLFNGQMHHYVTPKFYKGMKPSTGKTVPTWNYVAVQVYGKATVFFDPQDSKTDRFLSKQISDLSLLCEMSVMGYENPWQTSDALSNYLELMKKAIIGIQIKLWSMGGKWKMSQELPVGDREGVIEGFEAMGTDIGMQMAYCVKARAELTATKRGSK